MKGWVDPRRQNPAGDAWSIEDGCLKAKSKPRITEDLFSVPTFGDFELVFEWRIAAAGNSGVKYRIQDHFFVVYSAPKRKFELEAEKSLATRDNDFVASNLAALLLDVRKDAASYARALKLAQRFANDAHPLSKAVLGWAQYRNGDYPAAERTLQLAVAANPTIAQLHYFLGMTYLKRDNTAGARQELSTAIELGKKPEARFFGLDEAKAALASL